MVEESCMLRYIETAPIMEITAYDASQEYKKKGIPFQGTPRKHPYDSDKIILIPDPYNQHTIFYEFRLSDILHAQDLASPVSVEGRGLTMMEIWIRKGSYALRSEPIIIE